MAIALVAHTKAASGGSDYTTPTIDTTGATLLLLWVTWGAGTTVNVTDNKSNTWTKLTTRSSTSMQGAFYYVANPTVGTGHTVHVAGADVGNGGIGACEFQAWSGIATTTPFDVQNGFADTASGHTTIQPRSITPSQDNELVVAGWGLVDPPNTTWTVDSSFTMGDIEDVDTGNNYGAAIAYLVQGTAAAVNPTFTRSNATTAVGDIAAIASFKASAGGGGGTTVTPSGFAVTGSLGTPTVVITLAPTGFALTASLGAPTPTTQTTVTVTPTGLSLTGSLGTFTVENDITMAPSGAALALSLGTPTTTGTSGNVNVVPTGYASTLTLGTPLVEIDRVFPVSGFAPAFSLGSPTVVFPALTVRPQGFVVQVQSNSVKITGPTSGGSHFVRASATHGRRSHVRLSTDTDIA